MRILQIKQAEAALADGRLDEACELLAGSEVRSHQRAQKLIGQLVRRLIDRGGEHLAAGHAKQALADCQKAAELGGNLSEAAELRGRIAEALSREQSSQRRQGDLVAAAREQLADGRLSVAEQLLADAGDDTARAAVLRHEAEVRRLAAEGALRRAAAALDRSDHAAAIDELLAARANRADTDDMAELTARAIAGSAARATEQMVRGRLDQAESLLRRLRPLAGRSQQVQDLLRVIAQCRRGWAHVGRRELHRAAEALRRAQAMLPEAAWLKAAADEASRGAAATEALRCGPLGVLAAAAAEPDDTLGPDGPSAALPREVPAGPPVLRPLSAEEAPEPPARGSLVPRRFLLRVDGAGSSLVLREGRVTIGPISSSQRPELGLLADPSLPVVTVERVEGDYFLRSASPVAVNDKPTTGRLLADGDKIALSGRCRLRFRLPNAASGSAVLELSTARLPQADVRRVILLDREMVVGPGAAAHVRTEHLPDRAVLYVRDGRLLCRTDAELTAGHEPLDPSAGIPLDTPVRVGPVGLVVNRA